jgi:hypothetical protein
VTAPEGTLRWQVGYRWWLVRHYAPARLRWHWHETLPWMIAMRLPRKIALLAFVRVYAATGECGPEYARICHAWERGA